MVKPSFRTAAILCLAIWAAVWLMFLLMRFSSFDIRSIPGIGPFMLASLAASVLAPIVATGFAGVASVRQPRVLSNWVTLACATAALVGQGLLFLMTRWL
jgi:hypothetical protein